MKISGLMLESNLVAGNQNLTSNLKQFSTPVNYRWLY